jgi:hypothetical protein
MPCGRLPRRLPSNPCAITSCPGSAAHCRSPARTSSSAAAAMALHAGSPSSLPAMPPASSSSRAGPPRARSSVMLASTLLCSREHLRGQGGEAPGCEPSRLRATQIRAWYIS